MIKYLIAYMEVRIPFGSFSEVQHIDSFIEDFEKEPTLEEREEFISKKRDIEDQIVIAISKLGENKWHYKK